VTTLTGSSTCTDVGDFAFFFLGAAVFFCSTTAFLDAGACLVDFLDAFLFFLGLVTFFLSEASLILSLSLELLDDNNFDPVIGFSVVNALKIQKSSSSLSVS
jgi:hypothetical protein